MCVGEVDAFLGFTDCFVDQLYCPHAVAAFVWDSLFKLSARIQQRSDRRVHVRLRGAGVTSAKPDDESRAESSHELENALT